MIVQEYQKAPFLGTMPEGSVQKKNALLLRKLELSSMLKNNSLPIRDRVSSQNEINEINSELAATLLLSHKAGNSDRDITEDDLNEAKNNLSDKLEGLKVQANSLNSDVLALLN